MTFSCLQRGAAESGDPRWHSPEILFSWWSLLTTGNTYLCLAVLDGVLCVIFLHGRNSPQSSPTSTPRLLKSLSFEPQPSDTVEKPMSPMQYARSGLGTAELDGKLIAAGKRNDDNSLTCAVGVRGKVVSTLQRQSSRCLEM